MDKSGIRFFIQFITVGLFQVNTTTSQKRRGGCAFLYLGQGLRRELPGTDHGCPSTQLCILVGSRQRLRGELGSVLWPLYLSAYLYRSACLLSSIQDSMITPTTLPYIECLIDDTYQNTLS